MLTQRKRKLVYLAVVLIALACAYAFYLRRLHTREHAASQAVSLSGNIEAHESVLSFKSVQSRIVELPFNEGQWVKRGAVVAVVDDTDYRQQIAIASAGEAIQLQQLESARKNLQATEKTVAADEAQLAQRGLDYRRNLDLSKKGFVSAAALDESRTALSVAEAALERDRALKAVAERNIGVATASLKNSEEAVKLARILHGYTVLTAPFDGVITVRQAELGEMMVPGTPVLTIADLDHVWLRAYLNETDLGRVRLGQQAELRTDSYPGKRYKGTISFISSKAEFTPRSVETHAERVTLVYRIKIDIDNPEHELVLGMPADAVIRLNDARMQ